MPPALVRFVLFSCWDDKNSILLPVRQGINEVFFNLFFCFSVSRWYSRG